MADFKCVHVGVYYSRRSRSPGNSGQPNEAGKRELKDRVFFN